MKSLGDQVRRRGGAIPNLRRRRLLWAGLLLLLAASILLLAPVSRGAPAAAPPAQALPWSPLNVPDSAGGTQDVGAEAAMVDVSGYRGQSSLARVTLILAGMAAVSGLVFWWQR